MSLTIERASMTTDDSLLRRRARQKAIRGSPLDSSSPVDWRLWPSVLDVVALSTTGVRGIDG
ncbi:hypothetical protein [Haladaptatus pallidirubidus]|uniref:hypothetical protein n=2 Tax=Haladaptatus pallidirubidus TaxID=1008152 RepID=UPI0036F1BE72